MLGLSATDRRAIEAHVKPRDSTRPSWLSPLCPSSKRAGNNIERLSMDDKGDQGGTITTS